MNIVISGFYGLGNTGDEAILEAIVDQLKTELNEPELTVLSLSPEKTAHDYKVNSIYRGWRHDNIKKIKALKKADLLISGGGGLLQDSYPTKFLFGPLPYYLLIVFLAKLCGTKVMFFSQGIGPVDTRWGKILMRVFANLAHLITVRDTHSKELLHSLHVTKPKTIVTADIVFAFKPKQNDICKQSLSLNGDEKLVAVSVRPCPWIDDVSYQQKIAHALDILIEQNDITPIFVPMEGHHDVKESQAVIEKMKKKENAHILDGHFTPSQYQAFISQCELTIGMRLHSLIFSAISSVPHIGISYDKKVESLLQRTGMWENSFTLDNLDSKELINQAKYVLQNHSSFTSRIKENAFSMKEDALENLTLLKKYFLKK